MSSQPAGPLKPEAAASLSDCRQHRSLGHHLPLLSLLCVPWECCSVVAGPSFQSRPWRDMIGFHTSHRVLGYM